MFTVESSCNSPGFHADAPQAPSACAASENHAQAMDERSQATE
jgi:hypothetical protein